MRMPGFYSTEASAAFAKANTM